MKRRLFLAMSMPLISAGFVVSCRDAAQPSALAQASVAEAISYNFQIRPILSDKCFFCHGPDTPNNKAGLRLDIAELAYAALNESEGHAWVAGSPEDSVAVQRIFSSDPSEIMPPPDSHLVLTEDEKNLIKEWVAQGAVYEPHWAFEPLPSVVSLPEDSESAANGIDTFVLQELRERGIAPSPRAEDEVWLRRVSFDLTGLPPSPESIEAFLSSSSPDKFAAKVDELLASHDYGKRMATPWLDAARYADSYGYQSDQLNVAWPYRDWVVRAFNENLPYDEFLIQNLAGDLLPEATRDQILATSFNRLNRLSNEGGSIREEFLIENAADRLQTFGTAVLGLTIECARCHDHKYDPIPMRDYYSLLGYFNSIDENGLYDHSAKIPSPSLLLPTDRQEAEIEKLEQKVAALEAKLTAIEKTEPNETPESLSFRSEAIGHFSFEQADKSDFVNEAAGGGPSARRNGLKSIEGKVGRGIELSGDAGVTIPKFYQSDRWNANTHALWLKDTLSDPEPVVVMQRTFGTDVGYNGYDLMLEEGRLAARWYRVWPGNAIGIETVKPIPKDEWTHVAWTYDGSSRANGIRIFLNGEQVETRVIRDGPMVKSAGVRTYGSGEYTLGQRFRDRGFAGGHIDEFYVFPRRLSQLEIRSLAHSSTDLGSASKEALQETYHLAFNEEHRSLMKELTQAREALIRAQDKCLEVAVMKELPAPRPTYLLERGAYDAPTGEPIKRELPSFLPNFGGDFESNRLGLAKWATHPDNPLTARVFVNRVWQEFFGAGLVETSENFGIQGGLPSHPELLDWLSRDFVDHGWNIKRLCRMIVLSETYSQSSRARHDLKEIDPENRLLARGPSTRLSAEMLRDTALHASGLLVKSDGGPPVSPYQPGGDLWRESNGMSPAFRQSKGDLLYRRSLYSVWKRTAPLPNMMAFDTSNREVCMVKRSQTNTPLQALVLLNDVQFVEAARVLANRSLDEKGHIDISSAFLKLTGRRETEEEHRILSDFFEDRVEYFTKHAGEAQALKQQGEFKEADRGTPAQIAAATLVCQAIMNLDASVWKR